MLPELLEDKGVEQGGHHNTDVWTHSLDALDSCPSPDPVVRLATLLHDVGKPRTKGGQNGAITFYNHEIIGSRMASKIAQRLKLSRRDTDRVFLLVRYHMFYYQPHNTDAAIRHFMRKVGLEPMNVIDLAIYGDDLIRDLNLKPVKKIGEILNTLFEKVLENPELNEHGALIQKARELL